MKKTILTLAVVAITLGSTAFAGEINVDKRVRRAFEKDFAGAVDVKWSTLEDCIKVDFSLNDVPLIACYNAEGEKLAVIRNIQFSILPLVLQFDQKRHFSDYWISQLFELVNGEGTHYYLTVENAEEKIQLVSHESSEWELIRKEKKN